MVAPTNRIADPVHMTEQDKGCQSDVYAEQHREHVGEAAPRVRPKPVGRRKLEGHPASRKDEKSFPRSRRFLPCGGGEGKRNENKASDSSSTCERKSICPQGVNQVHKEHGGAEKEATARAEARGEATLHAARGNKQHHQKQTRESRDCGRARTGTGTHPRGE